MFDNSTAQMPGVRLNRKHGKSFRIRSDSAVLSSILSLWHLHHLGDAIAGPQRAEGGSDGAAAAGSRSQQAAA